MHECQRVRNLREDADLNQVQKEVVGQADLCYNIHQCKIHEVVGLMNFDEQTVESISVYKGLIVDVRRDKARLHNGKIVDREVVEHPGGVAVLPLDEDGNVTLVRQFRYTVMRDMLEIPAGKLEIGEDPEECGRRELHEEVGLTANKFDLLCVMRPSAGISTERLYLYLARDLEFIGLNPDTDEFLEVIKMPLAELADMAVKGEIEDAKTALAVMLSNQLLSDNKTV